MITVKYYGHVRALTGKIEEQIEAKTVNALLKEIRKSYGNEVYSVAKSSLIAVNGENASLYGGYRMKLLHADLVQLFPVCAGG